MTTEAPAKASANTSKTEIAGAIKGSILPRLKQYVPELADIADPQLYNHVIGSPDLLYGCLQAFANNRANFKDITVGVGGAPVVDNSSALRCERSVNDIVGMVVRSGAKNFAKKVLDDGQTIQRTVEEQNIIDRLTKLVREMWRTDAVASAVATKTKTKSEQFYDAIRDNLDYDWQVPLFPYYVELPPRLVSELGKGLTTLRTPDGIRQIAEIGRESLDDAKRIVGDELAREMLDTNPRSARGVAYAGKAEFERLNSAFGAELQELRWEVFNDHERLEVLQQMDTKAIAMMAQYLPVVSSETLKHIQKHLKELYQIESFFKVGWDMMGQDEFVAVFGNPGKPNIVRKITEKMGQARSSGNDPAADFSGRLQDVFRAYLANPVAYGKS